MTIYPPYTKWKTVIKDPVAFQQFLRDNTDFENTGRYTKYQGEFSEEGFLIARNLTYGNSNRPLIRGRIAQNISGEHELTLSIESRKTLLYVALLPSGFIVLSSIIQLEFLMLVFIPVIFFWFWLGGLILHQIEISKTKIELEQILAVAQG